jgi:hypothetical protein
MILHAVTHPSVPATKPRNKRFNNASRGALQAVAQTRHVAHASVSISAAQGKVVQAAAHANPASAAAATSDAPVALLAFVRVFICSCLYARVYMLWFTKLGYTIHVS